MTTENENTLSENVWQTEEVKRRECRKIDGIGCDSTVPKKKNYSAIVIWLGNTVVCWIYV